VWYRYRDYNFALIGVVFLSLLLGRFLHVFALGRCFNLSRRPETRLTWGMQALLAWSGLRGAVAFALSLQTPKGFDFDAPTDVRYTDYPLSSSLALNCTCDASPVTPEIQFELQRSADVHEMMVTTTLINVFLTIFILGGLTSSLLSLLGLSGVENLPSEYAPFFSFLLIEFGCGFGICFGVGFVFFFFLFFLIGLDLVLVFFFLSF
jgi:hypothetical protein